ncbi:hypothetical protein ACFYRC_05975 [Streptomyces sp. NPDC005279]|uniref:hypothetical protein n=1 Tax=Streptomyces sp. NPDC005279 TaxID=3364712 RepID=UPI0036980794
MPTTVTRVADAEQQLTAATLAQADATAALGKLKAKILEHGAEAVTAEDLAAATHAAEHAALATQHATLALESARQTERLHRLEDLKASILEQAGDPTEAVALVRQIEDAATRLIALCADRQRLISRATAAMRGEGVPRYEPGGKSRTNALGITTNPYTELTDQHAGLGWQEAGMTGSDAVVVEGRRVGLVSAGVLLAAALDRASRGRSGHLAPALEVRRAAPQGADLEQWVRATF